MRFGIIGLGRIGANLVVSTAQTALMQSRDADSPAAKAVALLRNQFGAHPLHRASTRETGQR